MTPLELAELTNAPEPICAHIESAIEKMIAAAVAAEREACARIATNMTCFDCDSMGHQDPETGEIPCSAESRGEVCVCAEKTTFAHEIAHKIRARNKQS